MYTRLDEYTNTPIILSDIGCVLRNVPTGRIGEADRVSEELDDENMGTCIPQGGRVTRCQSLEGMKSKLEGMSRHLEVVIG